VWSTLLNRFDDDKDEQLAAFFNEKQIYDNDHDRDENNNDTTSAVSGSVSVSAHNRKRVRVNNENNDPLPLPLLDSAGQQGVIVSLTRHQCRHDYVTAHILAFITICFLGLAVFQWIVTVMHAILVVVTSSPLLSLPSSLSSLSSSLPLSSLRNVVAIFPINDTFIHGLGTSFAFLSLLLSFSSLLSFISMVADCVWYYYFPACTSTSVSATPSPFLATHIRAHDSRSSLTTPLLSSSLYVVIVHSTVYVIASVTLSCLCAWPLIRASSNTVRDECMFHVALNGLIPCILKGVIVYAKSTSMKMFREIETLHNFKYKHHDA